MDVFVIPIGPDRYELYCESPVEAPQPTPGSSAPSRAGTGLGRLQEWIMAWVAERIAEQRLLWNLRRETAVVAFHPQDLTFEQAHTLIRRTLQRDYERHRVWLVVDGLLLIGSIALILVPGPNIIGYYFAFRVMGHWLSIRGALQGLRGVMWAGQPCEPLTKLREAALLNGEARDRRVHEIAEQLRLPHLSTFFERVAVRHAS
jgi:hypothetical protein